MRGKNRLEPLEVLESNVELSEAGGNTEETSLDTNEGRRDFQTLSKFEQRSSVQWFRMDSNIAYYPEVSD